MISIDTTNAPEKRAAMVAVRCVIERLERTRDEKRDRWLKCAIGSRAWKELADELHGLDMLLISKGRELAELQGRRWLEVVR